MLLGSPTVVPAAWAGALPNSPGDPLYCQPDEGAQFLTLNNNQGFFWVGEDCLANSIVTPPTHGTLTSLGLDGYGETVYAYAPSPANYTGTDTFTVSVESSENFSAGGPGDFGGGSGNVVITLNVLPSTPIAVRALFNTPVTITVPAGSLSGCPPAPVNGGYGPPATTVYGCVTAAVPGSVSPSHGTLNCAETSLSCTYTLTDANFSGVDTFTVQAAGIDDYSVTALRSSDITVNATAPPTAPTLGTWGLLLSALLLGGVGCQAIRRRAA
jgi:hypothetical protein